jgi:hypothetical protein
MMGGGNMVSEYPAHHIGYVNQLQKLLRARYSGKGGGLYYANNKLWSRGS